MTDAEIMRRGALWADLAFFDVVPRDAEAPPEPMRLEMLGQVRSCRLLLFGRTILFAAPGFFDLLRLARMRRDQPMLRARLCLIPGTALREHLLDHAAPALMDNARQNLARIWPRAAAHIELTKPVRWTAAIMVLILALLALLAPLSGQLWLVPLWAAMVILPTLIRFAALFSVAGPEIEPEPGQDRADLPLYSILVPLRDEANMVDQICANLRRIDYPGEKLQILFVVESRSPRTIAAIRRHLWDMRFALVVVPDAAPRTKPKALDFALPLCRGEFVVVYDAEDRPDPDQLLRMVAQFRGEPDITCIQARLVIGNGGEGSLPALFAGEYAGLFAVLLPALARWGLLVPLGGTSNHFRVAQLRQLGGWDAFNVTEDADLGVRLARRGLRTATSTSRTFEDAPVGLGTWMGQRTRWMKGWLQTLVVHNCHPLLLRHDLGWRGTLLFEILILGMLLAPLLHAGFIFTLVGLYFTETLAWPSGGIWPLTCLGALFFGHGVAIATNLLGLRRTGQPYLSHWQALLPAYWLLMAWATLRALHEFAVRPFHWFKTPHRTSPTQRSRAGRQTQFVRRPILR
ncbi:MAG: hypothetical protein ABS75_00315 [Pelagibacterium sp. SCN 63-23]|nr:MAG: hypothetical protein ABS75_00315 [Pelagibacterium sp. SCN 63-23]